MDPYIGEIRIFTYNFVPLGWLPCDGRQLNVGQYQGLYAVINGIYGGSPGTTFNLPDLRQRVVMGTTPSVGVNSKVGTATVALTTEQIPGHTHEVDGASTAKTTAFSASPGVGYELSNLQFETTKWTTQPSFVPGSAFPALVAFSPDSIGAAGSGAAHDNMQPYLTLQFCIATEGVFPMRP